MTAEIFFKYLGIVSSSLDGADSPLKVKSKFFPEGTLLTEKTINLRVFCAFSHFADISL